MFMTTTDPGKFIENPVLEMSIEGDPMDEFELYGKTWRMRADPWKHHVHLKCTNLCDANCAFCIERPTREDPTYPIVFLRSAGEVLEQMYVQGQLRTVSVTGGEPTIFSRIDDVISLAGSYPLRLFNINTNGRMLDAIRPGTIRGWVNISRHDVRDSSVFRRKWQCTPEFVARCRARQPDMKVRYQCVLGAEGGLATLSDIRRFMDATEDEVDDFSFRSLIIEDSDGRVPPLFRELRSWLFGNGWCTEQTIQDYYVYETFRPDGRKPVTISWSNMGLLRRYNESVGGNFLEEIIVHPDGMVTGSWNRQSLVIKEA